MAFADLYSTELAQDRGYRVLRHLRSCRDKMFDRFVAAGRPEQFRQDVVFWSMQLEEWLSVAHLGKSRFICNTDIKRFMTRYPTVEGFVLDRVPVSPADGSYSTLMRFVLDRWHLRAARTRRRSNIFRVETEIMTRAREGWFLIFETLDVAPEHYSKVFAPGSMIFSDYIRSIKRAVGAAVFGSFREAERSGQDYFSYFGVIERGKLNGRLHFHVILFCRGIPSSWRVDPNRTGDGTNTQILAVKSFWRYGFGCPKAVRFSPSDAFGSIGWRWPCVRDEQGNVVPLEAGPPVRLARYVSKYVTKATYEEGEFPWRTRMSRGLGLQTVKLALKTVVDPLRLLEPPVMRSLNLALKRCGLSLPPKSLLRRVATRKWLSDEGALPASWDAMLSVEPRRQWRECLASLTRRRDARKLRSIGSSSGADRGRFDGRRYAALMLDAGSWVNRLSASDVFIDLGQEFVNALSAAGYVAVGCKGIAGDASSPGAVQVRSR